MCKPLLLGHMPPVSRGAAVLALGLAPRSHLPLSPSSGASSRDRGGDQCTGAGLAPSSSEGQEEELGQNDKS